MISALLFFYSVKKEFKKKNERSKIVFLSLFWCRGLVLRGNWLWTMKVVEVDAKGDSCSTSSICGTFFQSRSFVQTDSCGKVFHRDPCYQRTSSSLMSCLYFIISCASIWKTFCFKSCDVNQIVCHFIKMQL